MEPINLTGNLGAKFKAKFPMPQSSKEKAVFVVIAGLATVFASGFDPARDLWALQTGHRAPGKLVATGPATGIVAVKQIGQYIYLDRDGVRRLAASRRPHKFVDDVPKALTIAWPKGRPEKARAIGEYWHHAWPFGLGVLMSVLGLAWHQRASRPDQAA